VSRAPTIGALDRRTKASPVASLRVPDILGAALEVKSRFTSKLGTPPIAFGVVVGGEAGVGDRGIEPAKVQVHAQWVIEGVDVVDFGRPSARTAGFLFG
jgi:hypothetical protein